MIPGVGGVGVVRMGLPTIYVKDSPRRFKVGTTCLCGCGIHPLVLTLNAKIPAEDLLKKTQFSELEKILGRTFWIEDQGDESGSER